MAAPARFDRNRVAVFDPDWYLAHTQPCGRTSTTETQPPSCGSTSSSARRLATRPTGISTKPGICAAIPGSPQAVRTGRVASAFDAYCREGLHGRSPHWLFDEFFYRTRHPDLTEACLAADGVVNGYDHYLRHGDRSGRSGHPLFDPATYRAQLDPAEQRNAEALGYFTHYLQSLSPTVPSRAPRSISTRRGTPPHGSRPAATDDRAGWLGALHHYLDNETPTEFDPLAEFSERYYLGRYADAAGARQIRPVSQWLRALPRRGKSGAARAHPADRPRPLRVAGTGGQENSQTGDRAVPLSIT